MLAVTTMQVLKVGVTVAALIVAPLMARVWRRVAERPPRIEGDKLVVSVAGFHAVVMVLIAAVCLGVAVWVGGAFPSGAVPWWFWLFAGGVCVLMSVLGVAGLLTLRVRLELDAVGLRGRRALSGYCELRWSDVVSVRYSKARKLLTVRGAAGQQVVAYTWMPGFHVLLEQLRHRVPAAIAARAIVEADSDPIV